MSARVWIIVVAIAVTCVSCSSKDPVDLLMADLEEAAEARDVKAVDRRLASGFTGNEGMSRAETLSLLTRYFAAYEKISLDVTNLERSQSGNRLNFRVSFSGQGKAAFGLQNLLPESAACVFELRLVNEGGALKVNRAVWQEVPAF